MAKHDGARLSLALGLQGRIAFSLNKRALGPTDFSEREATHFGWLRQAAAKARVPLHPIRNGRSFQYRMISYVRRPYTLPACPKLPR